LSQLSCSSRVLAGVVALAALASSGCGYALAGRGSFLPASIRVIAIPQLENTTTFLQVEQILTEKVRNEFIGRGKYQVITEPAGADAVLSGTITGISVQPVAFTNLQLASRYLFTLTMSVKFSDAQTNEVFWTNDALTFREEYDLTGATATTTDNTNLGATFLDQERTSFDRISTDLARTLVTAILEAF
jgi:hypothetical protein